MKRSFRYVMLLIATFMGTTAFATDWNIPEPKSSAFVPGDTFAIKNVGLNAFFYWGEAWGTQATVNVEDGENALKTGKYWLVFPEAQSISPYGDAYYLRDNSKGWGNNIIWRQPADGTLGSGIKGCFPDGIGNNDSQRLWIIKNLGGGKYGIQVPETNTLENNVDDTQLYVEGEYLGVQTDHASTWAANNAQGVTYGLYYDVYYDDAPEYCQWLFYNKKDLDLYALKLELADLIDGDAAEYGIDTTAEAAVVNNPNSTIEDVQNAIDNLKKKLQNSDPYNHPEDVTDKYITNPLPLSGSSEGWTILDAKGNAASIGTCSDNIGEFWNNAGYSIHYTIKNLPTGIYTLRVEAYTRAGFKAVLRAGNNEMNIATVASGTVNNRATGRSWINAGNGINDLKWAQEETGDVEISLTADSENSDYWLCWGFWKLLDHGSSLDSYKGMAGDVMKDWEPEFVDEDGAAISPFTQDYFDTIKGVVDELAGATNKDEVKTVLDNYNAAIENLRQNVALYKKLKREIDEDVDPYSDDFGGYDDFADVFDEVSEIFQSDNYTFTNEELQALLDRYLEKQAEAIQFVFENAVPGQYVNRYIVNRRFKNEDGTQSSFDGWTVASSSAFQNNSGSRSVVEQWNSSSATGTISVYQEIAPIKPGVYQLKTKGWYRSTTNQETHDTNPAYTKINTYLYGASSEYEFHDIYEHLYTPEEKQRLFPKGNCYNPLTGTGYNGPDDNTSDADYIENLRNNGVEVVLPNDVTGADELFNNNSVDWYDMDAKFLGMGKDMPVQIGVRGRDIPGYGWLIWDDFELIYVSDKLEDMQPIAQEVADKAQEDLQGLMAKKTRDALQECIDGIENPANVDQLVDCYRRIDAAREAARNSVKLYQQLSDKLDELNNAMFDYNGKCLAEAMNQAEDLAAEMEEAIEDGSIDDENVPEALTRMNKAISYLKVPANYGDAADSNLIDFTGVIVNPTYYNGNDMVATLDGWTNATWTEGEGDDAKTYVSNATVQAQQETMGVAEGWGTTADAATFDLYQDIEMLPQGTYELRVSGLYRQEGVNADRLFSQYEYAVTLGKEGALNDEVKEDLIEYDPRGKFYGNGDYKTLHRWMFLASDEWANAAEDFTLQMNGEEAFIDSLTVGAAEEELNYYYFPNDRGGAYARFIQGYYENVLQCYVDESGKLRIGACNRTAKAYDWVPFTNWRLYYRGENSIYEGTTGVREVENAGLNAIDGIYTIDGRKAAKLQKGLNVVVKNGKAHKVLVK